MSETFGGLRCRCLRFDIERQIFTCRSGLRDLLLRHTGIQRVPKISIVNGRQLKLFSSTSPRFPFIFVLPLVDGTFGFFFLCLGYCRPSTTLRHWSRRSLGPTPRSTRTSVFVSRLPKPRQVNDVRYQVYTGKNLSVLSQLSREVGFLRYLWVALSSTRSP